MSEMTMTPKKRSKIPLIFVAGFSVMLAANGTMVYFALSSWTGLETKNAFIKGVNYNDNLEAQARQDALGWDSHVTLKGGDARQFSMSMDLKNSENEAVSGAEIYVKVIRPTHTGFDQELTLVEMTPGTYRAAIDLPLDGLWEMKALAIKGQDRYRTSQRFTLENLDKE